MNSENKTGLGQSVFSLWAVADKINEFGKQFRGRYYSTGAKAWKFFPDSILASVNACVCDDNGSLDEDSPVTGTIRLHLDVEFFRHDDTPQKAEQAESAVINFAESLGFNVKLDGDGSGEFGKIHCYILSGK